MPVERSRARRSSAATALTLCLAFGCGAARAQTSPDVAALESAAQRGDVPALMTLASMYERAENVERDLGRSNALYCKAAARGNVDALLKLGQIYASGREVYPNEGVGALLIHKAAELGSERAKELLPYITKGIGSALPPCLSEAIAKPAPEASQSVSASRVKPEIAKLVQLWAPQYALDPDLVFALISVESGFRTDAVSPKNAQGLMQLIPATAERFGVKNAFNPVDNLKGGLAYLRWLMSYFKGDVALVLAAYNAGEEAVERYRGIPPYRETREYVRQITSVYTKTDHPYDAERAKRSSITARSKPSL